MIGEEILTDHDRYSGTVKRLKEYYEHRLNVLRSKNDNMPLEKTERLRGRIAEAKHILSILNGQQKESDDTGE